MRKFTLLLILRFLSFALNAQTYFNYADGKPVAVNWKNANAQKLTDGSLISESLRINPKGQSCNIDIDLTAEFIIGGIHLYLDNNGILPLRDFLFQYKNGIEWITIPNSVYKDNYDSKVNIIFAEQISTSEIRMIATSESTFGILEIQVWGKDVPTPPYGLQLKKEDPFQTDTHWVCANQVAYNTHAPKGFTVPTAKSNLPFVVKEKESEKVVFEGILQNRKGDFTNFRPKWSKNKEYFIHIEGDSLKSGDSYPFIVGEHAIQKMAYKPAVKFFVDARSLVGSHPSAYGGTAWRDGAYYTYEVPSMVLLYLSNPEVFNKMPVTMNWDKEKELVFSKEFKPTKEPNDKDALKTVKAYYSKLPKPSNKKVPDIIQCIRFGIGWNVIHPISADPSGDLLGEQLHGQTIEQFAYFLYGFPVYKKYIDHTFYQTVLDSTLSWWSKSGLLEVETTIGDAKGRHCPGHSIMYSPCKITQLFFFEPIE